MVTKMDYLQPGDRLLLPGVTKLIMHIHKIQANIDFAMQP